MSYNNDPLRWEISFKFAPPSLVVETPSHRAAMERQPGMICIERIGLVRLRLLSNCPSVPQGGGHYYAKKNRVTFESKLTRGGGGAMTTDHLPKLTRIGPNAISPHGYSGHGIEPGTVFDNLAAQSHLQNDATLMPIPAAAEYHVRWTSLRRAHFETGAALK